MPVSFATRSRSSRALVDWRARVHSRPANTASIVRWPPSTVVERLARGDVYTRRLTFPEGLTIPEMAAIYESRGFGASVRFIEAATNPSLIRVVDRQAVDLEGYLFPETYTLPRAFPASRLVAMMVDRFLATYTDQWRRAAEELG